MKQYVANAIAALLLSGVAASAQDQISPSAGLESVAERLFGEPTTQHYEFTACITDRTDACPRLSYDQTNTPVHGPSLSETLDWISAQLIENGLVHLFEYQACQVAIDIMDGAPIYHSWNEQKEGGPKRKTRSVLRPVHQGHVEAHRYSSLGHITYLIKDRSDGTSETPMRVSYHNDAVVMDLGKLKEIKNYVGTGEGDELYFVVSPLGPVKFVYPRESHGVTYHAGTGFKKSGSSLLDRLLPSPAPERTKTMYGSDYTLFENSEPDDMLMLFHGPGDVDMNIRLTKAFLHAVDICDKRRRASEAALP